MEPVIGTEAMARYRASALACEEARQQAAEERREAAWALARRIEQEIADLERTVSVIRRHWESAISTSTDQDAYLNSVALNLHGLYSGLKRVFELIVVEIDGGTLGGDAWHAELLRQMTIEVPDVRPAVLRPDTA